MILKVPEHFDYRVCDADGKYLEFCTWCDTETGEAVHVKQPIERTIDHTGEESVATEWRYHKAPLIYERITNER
jgi:hypothetical protein